MSAVPERKAAVPSLERRLIRRLGLLFGVSILLVSLFYLALAWSFHHLEMPADMGEVATKVAVAVGYGSDGRPRLVLPPVIAADGWEVAALAADGAAITGSTMAVLPPMAVATGAAADGDFLIHAPDGGGRYGAVRHLETAAGPMTIELLHREAGFGDAIDWVEDELLTETLPTFVPLTVAAIILSWLTLRSTLRPLRQLAAEAQAARAYTVGTRLTTTDVPVEVLPVVDAANDALARADTMLRQQQRFLANVAHELRTPLAVMQARIDGLDDRAAARALLPDVERMSRLVDGLLSVVRLEAHHVVLDTDVDLVAVARDCLAQMAPLALSRNKEVMLLAPDRPVRVRGNAIALDHALRNLIDNALRYTPEGAAVEVTVAPGAAIDVRDHGPGVAAEDMDHLFEPFWRSDTGGGAAGLGLAIAGETAKLHGGQLTVRNCGDGGACFRLALPELTTDTLAAPVPAERDTALLSQ